MNAMSILEQSGLLVVLSKPSCFCLAHLFKEAWERLLLIPNTATQGSSPTVQTKSKQALKSQMSLDCSWRQSLRRLGTEKPAQLLLGQLELLCVPPHWPDFSFVEGPFSCQVTGMWEESHISGSQPVNGQERHPAEVSRSGRGHSGVSHT